ncbi:hypothetical protein FRC11_005029, partial [Ceratobasidium sp. 423]
MNPSVESSARPRVRTLRNNLEEATKAAGTKLKSSIRAVARCAGAFPPLKSALDDMTELAGVLEDIVEDDENLRDIFTDLQTRTDALETYIIKLDPETSNGSVALIIKLICGHLKYIKQHRGQGTLRGSDALKRARKVELLLKQLHDDVELRTWENTAKQLEETWLARLLPVYDAMYNSSYAATIQRGGCTTGTRRDLQTMLQDWAQPRDGQSEDKQSENPQAANCNRSRLFWMNGMAGTGKTTISYSLCQWLEANSQLGASFFCSRTSTLCQGIDKIIPTIAYQLGRFSPAYQSALCKALRDDPDSATRNIQVQFDKLILRPIKSVKNAVPTGVVIVIDALDECHNNYGAEALLDLLLTHVGNLPIKFFVTSRPEPLIREKMLSSTGLLPSVVHLHNIEASIVEGDIRIYLTDELKHISPRPTDAQVLQLAKQSGNLFIYAATLVRYIRPRHVRVDSTSRLQKILTMDLQREHIGGSHSTKLYEELDILYRKVLELAFHEDLENEELETMRNVLQTVVCVKEPVAIETLAGLLESTEMKILHSLEPLYSVLHIPEGGGLISTLHASFPDFLLNKLRAGEMYYCDETRRNEVLACNCFNVMRQQLQFNLCKLETSFVPDSHVPNLERRVEDSISSALFYACRFWGEHLRAIRVSNSDDLRGILHDFLSVRLLFWMEVLNLREQIHAGVRILQQLETWCKSQFKAIIELVHDAWQFVTTFANHAISQSTPHIYVSMLPFWPGSNPISRCYGNRVCRAIEIEGTAVERRRISLLATWSFEGAGCRASLCPDGTQVVLGVGSKVLVVDSITGLPIIGPLEGHYDDVCWVDFSPDGSQIASGSGDCTLILWEVQSGKSILGPLEGHSDSVLCVRFSHHGKLIASSSGDKTIIIRDCQTGEATIDPLIGHTGWVRTIEFFSDDKRLISGSQDGSCRIWDVRTGDMIMNHIIHSDSVLSFSLSPDGKSIVSSGADLTIKLWDLNTGRIIADSFKGHTNSVESVQFSPNGSWIASASSDMTVRVWEAPSGRTIIGPLEGHLDTISSVVFTPDGSRLVTCADDSTVRVWDLNPPHKLGIPVIEHTNWVQSAHFSDDNARIISVSVDGTIYIWGADDGRRLFTPLQTHSFGVSSLTTSPDGSRVLAGSRDGSVRMWDAQTGKLILRLVKAHSHPIFSVALSPDGSSFVSSSVNAVQLWDSQTGRSLGSTVDGHTDLVLGIRFSPDGSKIASCSADRSVCIWGTSAGLTRLGTLEGHTDSVLTVAFSPDGSIVVSGSCDCTLRLWDIRTVQAIGGPLGGHTNAVTSVDFSPDGAYIASCSDDFTIRIWETRSGQTVLGPLKADPNYVKSVRFSPDGSRIVSGGADLAVRVWDLQKAR